jgi:hypothetical protein
MPLLMQRMAVARMLLDEEECKHDAPPVSPHAYSKKANTSRRHPWHASRQREATADGANGDPGAFDLFAQRMTPVTVEELRGAPTQALSDAEIAVIGPVPAVNAKTLALYDYVTSKASFAVLIPHPVLLENVDSLTALAPKFRFVCLNKAEARLLDPATDDVDKLALRVRRVLGDGTVSFALTDGANPGWLWDEYNGRFSWLPIHPLPVRVKIDAGGGDIITVSYPCFRRLFGEPPAAALQHSLEVAAAHVSGQPLTALLNTGSSSTRYAVPAARSSR